MSIAIEIIKTSATNLGNWIAKQQDWREIADLLSPMKTALWKACDAWLPPRCRIGNWRGGYPWGVETVDELGALALMIQGAVDRVYDVRVPERAPAADAQKGPSKSTDEFHVSFPHSDSALRAERDRYRAAMMELAKSALNEKQRGIIAAAYWPEALPESAPGVGAVEKESDPAAALLVDWIDVITSSGLLPGMGDRLQEIRPYIVSWQQKQRDWINAVARYTEAEMKLAASESKPAPLRPVMTSRDLQEEMDRIIGRNNRGASRLQIRVDVENLANRIIEERTAHAAG